MKPIFYATAQPAEFITLVEARAQVVNDPGDDDALLNRLVRTAVELVEKDAGWMLGSRPVILRYMQPYSGLVNLALQSRTGAPIELRYIDPLAGLVNSVIELPPELNPILSVENIRYRDLNGAQIELTNHQVELHHRPAFIAMLPHLVWPDMMRGYTDSLQINCTAGLTSSSTSRCTELAKQAALLLVGHWYDNREAVLIGSISKDIELAYETLIESLKLYRYEGR